MPSTKNSTQDEGAISRRRFLGGTVMSIGALSAKSAAGECVAQGMWRPKKALLYEMLPEALPMEDRFKLARDCGFEGVESPRIDPAGAALMRKAADAAGVRIHSIIFGGWDAPLSSGDASVIARGMELVRTNLHSAQIMGCDGILLVPAVVNAGTRYVDAWTRSRENIRKLLPDAEKRQIALNIEEVWNNFLLSPLEYVRYIDDFKSPWLHSYFDVGNVVRFAWPEDWILTVGKRIHKVHLKDFKGGPGLGTSGSFVNLLEGSINWGRVRQAFMQVGYSGFMTTELGGGDATYLKDVSARVDKIIAGTT